MVEVLKDNNDALKANIFDHNPLKHSDNDENGDLVLNLDNKENTLNNKTITPLIIKNKVAKPPLKCFDKILYKTNPLPLSPTRCQKLKYALLCPPHGLCGHFLTVLLVFVLFYAALWALVGQDALPNGNFFSLMIVFLVSNIFGQLSEKVKLPSLFGMLLAGFALRNIPYFSIYDAIDQNWSGALRKIALVVILTRAGLGLDPVALKRLSLAVLRLAFTPCLIETLVHALTTHYILSLPWVYAIMLGFILSAVSPAVVVPCLLQLDKEGYGVDEGIPTLIIAASSIDDILAITGFTIAMGITFVQGSIAFVAVKVPLEAISGVVFGILFGIIFWYLPTSDEKNNEFFRFMILLFVGLFCMFGGEQLHCGGFGPIAVLVVAFVAQLRWRSESKKDNVASTESMFSMLWTIFQPFLFGLIGIEVSLHMLDSRFLGSSVGVLLIGLAVRIIVTFLVTFGNKFNFKEMFFISIAWLPKATVQAAIGSVPLDMARSNQLSEEELNYSFQILTLAVLSIVITAPIGSVLISFFGPRYLKKSVRISNQPMLDEGEVLSDNLTNQIVDDHV